MAPRPAKRSINSFSLIGFQPPSTKMIQQPPARHTVWLRKCVVVHRLIPLTAFLTVDIPAEIWVRPGFIVSVRTGIRGFLTEMSHLAGRRCPVSLFSALMEFHVDDRVGTIQHQPSAGCKPEPPTTGNWRLLLLLYWVVPRLLDLQVPGRSLYLVGLCLSPCRPYAGGCTSGGT